MLKGFIIVGVIGTGSMAGASIGLGAIKGFFGKGFTVCEWKR